MLVTALAVVLLFCALPSAAAGQSWADAYRAGDYRRAADLLHPIVVDQESLLAAGDPGPARHLAILYTRGLGVSRDPIAACALADIAQMLTATAPPPDTQNPFAHKDRLDESQRFVREHCGALTDDDRLAASRSMGCWAFGMKEEVLTVGDRTIRVGRSGIRVTDAPDDPAAPDLGCPQVVVRVRAVTIDPPSAAAPGIKPRYFVELIDWTIGRAGDDARPRYILQWQLYELRGERVETVLREAFDARESWPGTDLPPDLDRRLELGMIRSGHVRWRIDGAPPTRGWIMLAPDHTP